LIAMGQFRIDFVGFMERTKDPTLRCQDFQDWKMLTFTANLYYHRNFKDVFRKRSRERFPASCIIAVHPTLHPAMSHSVGESDARSKVLILDAARIGLWAREIGASECQAQHLVKFLREDYLLLLPSVGKGYRKRGFALEVNKRHLWYRQAAKTLG
jgi:hypothetical protein